MLCLIAALDRHRLIGHGNALPWHLPEDLRHFRALTLGHPVIMGRKTYQSIGRPLPGRRNLVLTRDLAWSAAGVETIHSLEAALEACADAQVFVIGGAQLYEQALPHANCLYLTEIDASFEGDTWFPDWPRPQFRERSRETHQTADFSYHFVCYERINPVETS